MILFFLFVICILLIILIITNTIENFRNPNPNDEEFLTKCYKKNLIKEMEPYYKYSTIIEDNNGMLLLTPIEKLKNLSPLGLRDYLFINYVCVDKDYRRKGIGSKLIKKCIETAKKENKNLLLTVNIDNNQALNLYNKFGFRKHSNIKLKDSENKVSEMYSLNL